MRNCYYKRSKLTAARFRQILRLFALDLTASDAARLSGVSVRSVNDIYLRLRDRLARECERRRPFKGGEVEIDESYFGGHRKGKPGRGAAGKVAVFGLLKRGGNVYTQMIADARRETLLPIIKRRVRPDSVVYSDTWASYDTLSVEGYHHRRISHQQSFAEADGRHINGIENFWNQAKRHLRRFNGVPKESFRLFLKECEWRFNTGNPAKQLASLRQLLKKHSAS